MSSEERVILSGLTSTLKVLSRLACFTYTIAININKVVISRRFHCEMKKKEELPALVCMMQAIVCATSAKDKMIRSTAKNLVETQGAAFKWSIFINSASLRHINVLKAAKKRAQQLPP